MGHVDRSSDAGEGFESPDPQHPKRSSASARSGATPSVRSSATPWS